jgi:predicted histone-like DNA-binding protein
MAITYQIVGCSNPRGAEGVDYACCRRTKTGDLQLESLIDEISRATTVTPGEVKGILNAFLDVMATLLRDGNPVIMDEIGTFSARLSGKCYAQSIIKVNGKKNPDFQPASYLSRAYVGFRPAAALKKYLRTHAQFRRVPSELMA